MGLPPPNEDLPDDDASPNEDLLEGELLAALERDVLWRETGFRFLEVSNDTAGFFSTGLDPNPSRLDVEDGSGKDFVAGLEEELTGFLTVNPFKPRPTASLVLLTVSRAVSPALLTRSPVVLTTFVLKASNPF